MQEIKPLFDFSANESSILIHQSQAEITINQHAYTGSGEVRLELFPQARIYLYGYFQGIPTTDALDARFMRSEISSFSLDNRQIEGFLLSIGGDVDSQEFNLKWCPKSQSICGVGDDSTKMSLLVFHLFNFDNIFGTRRSGQQVGSVEYMIEHVDLICDEWTVELKSLPSTKDALEKLKKEGGYRLTHIASARKADGTSFSGKDAQVCLSSLHYFLSFAKGGWCNPMCAVGFDEIGNRVWEFWSPPREPWRNPLSWFDPQRGNQLAALYPAFIKKWKNDNWREALKEVIYWYLNANSSERGIDVGIILTQAAIERLAYEYAVKDKRLLLPDAFKGLRASDEFRLLFSSLSIPLEIPKETPEIAKLSKSKDFKWLDAPHALTEIRNFLVHPEREKLRQLTTSVYREAWGLGLWYLEMGVLAVCEYSETYANRLKKRIGSQVEKVPWS
jgi:hypothetical protein